MRLQDIKGNAEIALRIYNEVNHTDFTLDSDDANLQREMPLLMADVQYMRENLKERQTRGV